MRSRRALRFVPDVLGASRMRASGSTNPALRRAAAKWRGLLVEDVGVFIEDESIMKRKLGYGETEKMQEPLSCGDPWNGCVAVAVKAWVTVPVTLCQFKCHRGHMTQLELGRFRPRALPPIDRHRDTQGHIGSAGVSRRPPDGEPHFYI